MKILVIGSSGRVGFRLTKYLINSGHDVIPTFFSHSVLSEFSNAIKVDITDHDEIVNLISKVNPELVIHAAALANVDLCETEHSLADLVNIQSTQNIVDGCKTHDIKIIYFSTSYVFDGKKSSYIEEDECSPTTYYGYTKFKGETIVKNSNLSYLILRIDQPYGWIEKWQNDNSVTRILKNFETGKPTQDVIDWFNNPTLVYDLTETTRILVDKKLTGIYHIVGPDFINRFEWAKITAEVFGKDKSKIKPIYEKDLNLPAKRSKVNLSNKKIQTDTKLSMRGVKEGLFYMKENHA